MCNLRDLWAIPWPRSMRITHTQQRSHWPYTTLHTSVMFPPDDLRTCGKHHHDPGLEASTQTLVMTLPPPYLTCLFWIMSRF